MPGFQIPFTSWPDLAIRIGDGEEFRKQIEESLLDFSDLLPVCRVGRAEDEAESICFLSSHKADWGTCAVWGADGGVIARRN